MTTINENMLGGGTRRKFQKAIENLKIYDPEVKTTEMKLEESALKLRVKPNYHLLLQINVSVSEMYVTSNTLTMYEITYNRVTTIL